MRYLVFVFVFFIDFIICAQIHKCRINSVNPDHFLKEVKEFRENKQYDKVISLLQSKLENDSVQVWHYYQLACFYALKDDTIESFHNIYRSIELGAFSEDILSDSDFENLKKTFQWKILVDTLKKKYLQKYPDIKNKDLSVKLWLLGIEDQKTRMLKQNDKKKYPVPLSKEWKKINKQFAKETRKRTKFIYKLIRKNYWPLYSDVGQDAAFAAIMIVQHSVNNRLTKKALPLIKKAVKEQQADGYYYALVLDRYLKRKRKMQIYGTQYWRYSLYKDVNGQWVMSSLEFWPIENEDEVNSRRKSVGLNPIEKFAKSHNILYDFENGKCIIKHEKLKKKFKIE